MLRLNADICEGSIRQESGSEEQVWETETLSDFAWIEMANRQLKSGASLFGLRFLWQGSLAKKIRFCLQNLEAFGPSALEELTYFLRLVEYKIAHFKHGELSLYEQVNRGIQGLAEELRMQLERTGQIRARERDLSE